MKTVCWDAQHRIRGQERASAEAAFHRDLYGRSNRWFVLVRNTSCSSRLSPKARGLHLNVCLWFPPSLVQMFVVSRWPAEAIQAPGLFRWWPAVPWGQSPWLGAVSRQLCKRGRGACRRVLWAVSGRDTCHLVPQSTEQGSGSATFKGG